MIISSQPSHSDRTADADREMRLYGQLGVFEPTKPSASQPDPLTPVLPPLGSPDQLRKRNQKMIKKTAARFTLAAVPLTAAVALLAGCTHGVGEAETATGIANHLKAAVPSVGKVVTITEDNDPNDLIGRPSGYTDAAIIYDSAAECTEPGVDCGATIEIWPSEADATARKEYIQSNIKSIPMLNKEYDTVRGPALLRVTGQIKPSRAEVYATPFTS